MSRLSDYKLLSFDVYGTLIDWETGVVSALGPLVKNHPAGRSYTKVHLLGIFHSVEAEQQARTPAVPYSQLLTTMHPLIADRLDLPAPSEASSIVFGNSVGDWPAFPDTVDALQRLSKIYKLVVLSNVDRASFDRTLAGPLSGAHFDAILTAQDIGSYKPNPRNFEYMLEHVSREFRIEKSQILQTAQSQYHDHYPAKKMGIKSVWIKRPGAVMGNQEKVIWDWKFDTMGEMADAVEKEKEADV